MTLFQDCITFAGPTDGDIESCSETDLSTCSAYIEEECQYTGERRSKIKTASMLGRKNSFKDLVSNYLPQRTLSHLQRTSQAFTIVKSGQRRCSLMVQTSSTFLESPRSVRSLLICSLRAVPWEDPQQHRLWRNAKVGCKKIHMFFSAALATKLKSLLTKNTFSPHVPSKE